MEEHKKFSKLTAILLLVLIVVGAFGAWFFWKNYDDDRQEFASDDVVWVDYTNERYNVTFKYPENAEIKELDDGQYYQVFVEGPERSYFVFVNRLSEDATIDQFVTDADQVSYTIDESSGVRTTNTTTTALDAGLEGEGLAGDAQITYYWFEKDGKVFNVYTDRSDLVNIEEFIDNFKIN